MARERSVWSPAGRQDDRISGNLGNSDTLTIYRDTLPLEAARGRYKEATNCITTMKATAIGHRGNKTSDRTLATKDEAPSGRFPAHSNQLGADR